MSKLPSILERFAYERILRWGIPLLTLFAALVCGVAVGIEIAFLVLAGGALIGVIALLWSSVQSLTGESPLTFEEALGMGAPSAEEEQKRAILRALKDLEFERSVGKISAEDYQIYSARYRADAKRLIQAVDESLNAARGQVEDLLKARLEKSKAIAQKQLAAVETRSKTAPESDPAAESVAAGSAENEDETARLAEEEA